MAYEIYIGNYNRTKVLQLPIPPKELPTLSSNPSNETFETYWDLPYNFIEKKGLIEFTLEGWLPVDYSKYSFVKSKVNATEVIDLIESSKTNTEPIRIVINSKSGYYVNDTFAIESFEYNIIKRGDYKYSLKVKQWRDYNTTITTTNYTVGWSQDSTGWYYYTDTSGNYYKDSWQLIDNEYYSFDAQGYARQSMWLQDGGYWYYLKDSCKMARNEWVTLDGKSYYFGDQGGMYVNSYTPDGYWVGSDGTWVQ
ncbi:cell wall-binding protein [Clostridium sp.]|uniref:cell wall-binding protein n=1 Tax=Clostridium sp. TaxID=1506 RepID=UPI00260CE0A5|nr:cell wall-binding protein [Clostridium sp.]